MSGLSPSDAAVAVRSFPRRFRSLLARPDADDGDGTEEVDPDELARRPGPDGTSAADHLLAADGVLALLGQALEQAGRHDAPEFPEEVADLRAVRPGDTGRPLGALLEQLQATAEVCAERIDRVPTDEWGRPVHAGGRGAERSLLELVQEGVDVVATHLRAATRTIAAVT